MGDDPRGIVKTGEHVFEDAGYAQEILQDKHDFPDIRDAILEDIAEYRKLSVADLVKTANPAGEPKVLLDYIANGPKPGGLRVQHLMDRAQTW